MSDVELAELDAASRALGRLVRELQGGGER